MMNNNKRGNSGICYRRLPDSANNVINTLYGKSPKMYVCKSCGELTIWSDFYYPKSMGDKFGEPKPMSECCRCNDAGRLHRAKIKRRVDKGKYIDKETLELNPNTLEEYLV